MALTGLQIQKLLPKTNCKECGSNTCLAFAMKLAAKKAELTECPYASEELKAVLGAASEPPVKTLSLGGPQSQLKLGGETVLYRHEKTFVSPTLLGVNINDTDSPESIEQALAAVVDYKVDRVGETYGVELVAVTQKGNDPAAFAALASKAFATTGKALVLRSNDKAALEQAAVAVKGSRSILCPADAESAGTLWPIAKENGHALAVTGPDLDTIAAQTEKIKAAGFNDLLIQLQTHSPAEHFQVSSIARRSAIRDNHKPVGYTFIRFLEGEPADVASDAVNDICKYGGVCIVPKFDAALFCSLITLRLNIFTDPQKPIQVEPNLYPIGEPNPDSPVFVTTNFSLTYFVVSGEIENSGTSAWLLVPECEGMSVLTAWAAGKFNGATIGKFAKEIGLDTQVKSRKIVLPGYVAQISGELEESMPGWKVLVGPQEAGDIESFVKSGILSR